MPLADVIVVTVILLLLYYNITEAPMERFGASAAAILVGLGGASGDVVRRTASGMLGDLLDGKPGVRGSSFAPGAAARTIMRGVGADRVGIVKNGLGGGGVSDLGEEHVVPVTPFASEQIEV